ncbi:MAG: LPS export ABC transporter ATP-binding protein [Rickettsiales bacterium]|nr:LPS export ABC transporter ATP-binding protein [Rickettsiales bacterium]
MNQDRIPFLAVSNAGLKAENLSKYFDKKRVLNNISLNLNKGESVAILGPNGAGKTTLFYILMGLIKSDLGTISLNGNNIGLLPMYRRAKLGLGYLPQESSIFRGLNVEENILSILQITYEDKKIQNQQLEKFLSEFGIEHLRYASSLSLSGGERRRLEIARCLASNPSFILLDEPLAGIDPIAVGEIKELIQGLKKRNIGLLITDHNVKSALEMVDRAYIVFEGKIISEGTPDEIIQDSEVRRVYLGNTF